MDALFTSNPVLSAWPFWILQIDPSADNRSIEKAYQKINNSLMLKIPNAEIFITPLGQQTRDEFNLREARSILTNPNTRLVAEFWYLPAEPIAAASLSGSEDTAKTSVDWCRELGSC
jgi:hypothetical protein